MWLKKETGAITEPGKVAPPSIPQNHRGEYEPVLEHCESEEDEEGHRHRQQQNPAIKQRWDCRRHHIEKVSARLRSSRDGMVGDSRRHKNSRRGILACCCFSHRVGVDTASKKKTRAEVTGTLGYKAAPMRLLVVRDGCSCRSRPRKGHGAAAAMGAAGVIPRDGELRHVSSLSQVAIDTRPPCSRYGVRRYHAACRR